MDYSSAEKALIFLPRLAKNYFLNFYGGEPLHNFHLIEKTLIFHDRKNKELNKKVHYSLTTNGSLLTKELKKGDSPSFGKKRNSCKKKIRKL